MQNSRVEKRQLSGKPWSGGSLSLRRRSPTCMVCREVLDAPLCEFQEISVWPQAYSGAALRCPMRLFLPGFTSRLCVLACVAAMIIDYSAASMADESRSLVAIRGTCFGCRSPVVSTRQGCSLGSKNTHSYGKQNGALPQFDLRFDDF